MALSVSRGLDTEVPLQDIGRAGKRGSNKLHPQFQRAASMRSGGAECAIGSCTSIGDDPAEGIGIRLCWNGERANGDQGIQPLSPLKAQAVLG